MSAFPMEQPPWYDSVWLCKYLAATSIVESVAPERVGEFKKTFDCLRTRPDFTPRKVEHLFDDLMMARIKSAVKNIPLNRLELHEARSFRRFVVHNDPFFTELQGSITNFVARIVGEDVEPAYNFLSLYSHGGICPVHMDSPEAKWTIDLCVEQSEPWPIHFSQVVPWPEAPTRCGKDWEAEIRQSPNLRFVAFSPLPGEAIVFSGSSQWHYRDRMTATHRNSFCHLLFFHYLPKGMRFKLNPKNWSKLFDIPELSAIA